MVSEVKRFYPDVVGLDVLCVRASDYDALLQLLSDCLNPCHPRQYAREEEARLLLGEKHAQAVEAGRLALSLKTGYPLAQKPT